MTYAEAIALLRQSGVDSPEVDARELFLVYGEAKLPIPRDYSSPSEALAEAVARRMGREPLQYIIGRVGFYREEYRVTPACLIPRSDTEHLVDYAVKNLPRGATFLDLCTGSGCVGISTLKNTDGTRCVMVDISEEALAVASLNAEENGVAERCELIRLDLTEGGEELSSHRPFAVLSNPPYVSAEEYRGLEPEIYAEPSIAFLGGEDGSSFYRRLLPLSLSLIEKGGFAAFEIGCGQGELMSELADEHDCSLELYRDFGGQTRVAVFRPKN